MEEDKQILWKEIWGLRRHWKTLKGDIGRKHINPSGNIAVAILVQNSGNDIGTWRVVIKL